MANNGAQPTVPTLPASPVQPNTQVADMEHFHTLATSGKLNDLIHKLAGTKAKK